MQRLVGGVTQGAAAAAALHEDGASWAWGEAAGASGRSYGCTGGAATCCSLAPTASLSSSQCGKSYSATPTSSSRASLGRMKISPVGRHVKDGGSSMAGAGARAQGQWPQHRTEDVFCLSRRRGRTDEQFFLFTNGSGG